MGESFKLKGSKRGKRKIAFSPLHSSPEEEEMRSKTAETIRLLEQSLDSQDRIPHGTPHDLYCRPPNREYE